MKFFPKTYTGQKATEDKYGAMKFANAVEAADSSNDSVAISPKRLQNAPAGTTTTAGVNELSTDAEAQARSATDKVLTPSNLAAEKFLQWADVTLTATEIKALETTQISLVPAQGAGTLIKFMGAVLKLNYGSEVFAESGDNLQIKYTDDSGAAVSQAIETTGFIDQSADTYTTSEPKIDAIVAASAGENAPLVIDNIGSAITGNASNDSTIGVRIFYQVMSI